MAAQLSQQDMAQILKLASENTTNLLRPIVTEQLILKESVKLLLAEAPSSIVKNLKTKLDQITITANSIGGGMKDAWDETMEEWEEEMELILGHQNGG